MVIGDRFAWGHMPKTAGETTHAMFMHFPELVQFADPSGTPEVHTTFVDRREEVEGKVLALNIRRLPTWILSRMHHRARWGVHTEDYRPVPVPSAAEMASSTFPDRRLGDFVGGGFEIERWLRAEHVVDDFLAFISELTDLTDETRERIMGVGRVNSNTYDRSLENWFTAEQVRELYVCNPLWAQVEERVYGDLALPE